MAPAEDPLPAPVEDPIAQRRWVGEAQARLFGDVPPPLRAGRFEIRERLGHGGLGTVWAAHDPTLDRPVALKLLLDGGASDRALSEARSLARLSHPHVVNVYEVGEHEGRAFIAMELVDGWTLRGWARETNPGWRRVREVLLAAGQGLAAAHRAGIIHRDFKPENVLVGRDGRVRVADFGLAAPHGASAGGLAGTTAYMAPEQREGRAVTAASDQYAFCLTAYELFAGARPGPGAPAPDDTLVPRRIWTVLRKGLAESPEDRWASMDTLLALLGEARRGGRQRAMVIAAVALAVAVALFAAALQLTMFSDWMAAARQRAEASRPPE